MKRGQPRLLIAWLLLPFLLLAYACEEDDAEPEPERTITTKWSAAGDQVAPLFRLTRWKWTPYILNWFNMIPGSWRTPCIGTST